MVGLYSAQNPVSDPNPTCFVHGDKYNREKNAAFCALLAGDPALLHKRQWEKMHLVYLVHHCSDPFAVQRSPKAAGQILGSAHTLERFCTSLSDVPLPPPATKPRRECVCLQWA